MVWPLTGNVLMETLCSDVTTHVHEPHLEYTCVDQRDCAPVQHYTMHCICMPSACLVFVLLVSTCTLCYPLVFSGQLGRAVHIYSSFTHPYWILVLSALNAEIHMSSTTCTCFNLVVNIRL